MQNNFDSINVIKCTEKNRLEQNRSKRNRTDQKRTKELENLGSKMSFILFLLQVFTFSFIKKVHFRFENVLFDNFT